MVLQIRQYVRAAARLFPVFLMISAFLVLAKAMQPAVPDLTPPFHPSLPFNSKIWIERPRARGPLTREMMADDLVKHHLHFGMDRREVRSLLGPAEFRNRKHESGGNQVWVYKLYRCRPVVFDYGDYAPPMPILQLSMSPDGKLTRIERTSMQVAPRPGAFDGHLVVAP